MGFGICGMTGETKMEVSYVEVLSYFSHFDTTGRLDSVELWCPLGVFRTYLL
jgi:hypothetical protein